MLFREQLNIFSQLRRNIRPSTSNVSIIKQSFESIALQNSGITFELSGALKRQQETCSACRVRLDELCTPSMGMNWWGESPLLENSSLIMLTTITTSQWQAEQAEQRVKAEQRSRAEGQVLICASKTQDLTLFFCLIAVFLFVVVIKVSDSLIISAPWPYLAVSNQRINESDPLIPKTSINNSPNVKLRGAPNAGKLSIN